MAKYICSNKNKMPKTSRQNVFTASDKNILFQFIWHLNLFKAVTKWILKATTRLR